jgi:catechol 2,3-dioxygenase-like lactoylglutathione lyase family enzyme
MDWTLEVVVLPVSDIDRSVAFYRDRVGIRARAERPLIPPEARRPRSGEGVEP